LYHRAERELLSIELRSIPRGMLLKNLLLLSEVVSESGCADWGNDRSEERNDLLGPLVLSYGPKHSKDGDRRYE